MGLNATDQASAFSPRTVLALVLVGVVSLAGLAVLAAYAPDFRGGRDAGAHALSKSAVGYAGAVVLAQEAGLETRVLRSRDVADAKKTLLIVAPGLGVDAADIKRLPETRRVLIVLPKWRTTPDPKRPGHVHKVGPIPPGRVWTPVFKAYAPRTELEQRQGVGRPVLHGVAKPFEDFATTLAPIDGLQTVMSDGWKPAIVDENGRAVLAYSASKPWVWLLADPDLLNNQGLARLESARTAHTILSAIRPTADSQIDFDVTLNGFSRGQGLGRLMLEPPWLGVSLVGAAAALLMGLHALARFGKPRTRGRALAMGSLALVDNSAGLFRLTRREHELAPAMVALVEGQVAAAAGLRGDRGRLKDLAARRKAADPDALLAEAQQIKTRDDLGGLARRLNQWKSEITRERG